MKRKLLLILLLKLLCLGAGYAQSVTVTTFADVVGGNVTSIAALNGSPGPDGKISLREAIQAANNEPNGSVVNITLPAGNYAISIAGIDNTCVAGDLDVLVAAAAGTKTVNISGAGAGSTIITGLAGERIFDVHAASNPGSITFSLSGVTLTGGSPSSSSGGAILAGRAGDITTINNCVFSNNASVGNGGAISQSSGSVSHNLTITNCTFNNNTAVANGAAVSFSGAGTSTVLIDQNVFTNNTATNSGGAIQITGTVPGPATCNIIRNTFTGNIANSTSDGGAAVYLFNLVNVNINHNRIIGNTAPNVAVGKMISLGTGGTLGGTMNTDNNWWGVNTGPAAADITGSAAANWLQLKTTASPNPIVTNQSTALTTGFLSNSANNAVSASNLTALVGRPVTWSGVGGSVTGQQATIQAAGTAAATYNETTGVAGAHSATAIVDSAPASGSTNTAALTVNKASVTASITFDAPDPSLVGQAVTVGYAVAGSSGNSPTVPTGNVSVSDGVNSATGTVAGGSAVVTLVTAGVRTITATYLGDANFNASPASAGAGHQVNLPATTTAITSDAPDASNIGQNVLITYTVTSASPGTPTGNVMVTDGVNVAVGTVAAGQVVIAFTTPGDRVLTATYAGDGNFAGSAGNAGHRVRYDTTTAITSDAPDPSNQGQSVTVNFTVTPTVGGGPAPTGNVTITDGVDAVTVPAASGTAGLALTTPGNRTLTATYAGDGFNKGGTSPGQPHTVINVPPTITGQQPISTASNTARTIVFADLNVTDPGNTYPIGFTLTVINGANYTRVGNSITPALNFFGTLSVPVKVNDGIADSNTFNLAVTVNPDPEFVKVATHIVSGAGGAYRISFIGNPGRIYTIQFTPAMVPLNWQFLGTRTANANGDYSIIDVPPANTPMRFYRSVFP